MSPEQLASKDTESGHQKALFAWASMSEMYGFDVAADMSAYSKDGLARVMRQQGSLKPAIALRWLHSIPNGGARDPKSAALMKAEGVKRGVADIFLPLPMQDAFGNTFSGLYIEMKTSVGTQSPEQKEFQYYCRSYSYLYQVCRHWQDAAVLLVKYITVPEDFDFYALMSK